MAEGTRWFRKFGSWRWGSAWGQRTTLIYRHRHHIGNDDTATESLGPQYPGKPSFVSQGWRHDALCRVHGWLRVTMSTPQLGCSRLYCDMLMAIYTYSNARLWNTKRLRFLFWNWLWGRRWDPHYQGLLLGKALPTKTLKQSMCLYQGYEQWANNEVGLGNALPNSVSHYLQVAMAEAKLKHEDSMLF